MFQVKQSKANILAWKAHLIRSVNQDEARIKVLESLDETTVLLIQDWAVKYLPRKYRETQTDWFAKKGIPWHITVVTRRGREECSLEVLTFVHVFKTSSQDSCPVLAIISDAVAQLKGVMPGLQSVYYRQDNAGCYHCGTTVTCRQAVGKAHGVFVRRLDFSDPQGLKAGRTHVIEKLQVSNHT